MIALNLNWSDIRLTFYNKIIYNIGMVKFTMQEYIEQNRDTIRANIRDFMDRYKISQADLARYMGYSTVWVWKFFNKEHYSIDFIEKCADFFGVPLERLFKGADRSNSDKPVSEVGKDTSKIKQVINKKNGLSKETKQALKLAYVDNLTFAQIGKKLGVTRQRAEQIVKQSLKKADLHEYL